MIITTLEVLGQRIAKDFSGSGLSQVCGELLALAKQTTSRIEKVGRPHWLMRFALAFVVIVLAALLYLLLDHALTLKGTDQLSDVMQGADAAVNLLIVLGGATFFLSTVETRWKRDRALKALHELRAIVHVIDMHQLAKDPSAPVAAKVTSDATSKSERAMSRAELMQYLDYCSVMFSLTAKCAALYAEKLSDPVVVDTVGDIERLTSNLSSKIWQKITIAQGLQGRDIPLPIAPQQRRPLA